MKIGIKEIAEKAGVSVAAVSLALNNKPGVGKATRDKIIEVAKELEYPALNKFSFDDEHYTIRFLQVSRHGHTININHEHFIADYLNGIMDSAQIHNMTVEIESFEPQISIDDIITKINNSTQIDGYLVLATELSEEEMYALLNTGKKIVFIDTYIYHIPADFVNMNNMDAVYKVVSYFKELKHTSIGLFKSSISTRNFLLREQAFYKAMDLMGLTVNEKYVFDVDSTFEGAYRDMHNYLEKEVELPTAIFAFNDIIALGCMKALQEKNISVPGELSLVAFDNLSMSEMTNPPLSSINVPKRQIGQVALDMLYLKLQHQNGRAPMVSLVSTDLVKRGSVAEWNGMN